MDSEVALALKITLPVYLQCLVHGVLFATHDDKFYCK